jgi:hypothetical protein
MDENQEIQDQPVDTEASLEDSFADAFEEFYSGDVKDDDATEEPAEEGVKEEVEEEAETEDEPEDKDAEDDDAEESAESEPVAEQPAKLSAKDRIKQLVDQKNDLKRELAEAQLAREELEKRQAVSTDKYPDPEATVKELQERYAGLPTVQQVLEHETINPVTGDVYTPAEAEAALANIKQDIQFSITDAKDAVVARMEQSRRAEQLGNELGNELSELIARHPQLNPEAPGSDPVWCRILANEIKANEQKAGGLLTGWAEAPRSFIASFEKAMLAATNIVANKVKSTDAKVTKETSKPVDESFGKPKTFEDEFMAMFDQAVKEPY